VRARILSAGLLPLCLSLAATLAVPAPAAAQQCAGDCDGNGRVTIDELLLSVRIGLGGASLDGCRAADPSGDGRVLIHELVAAAGNTLNACAAAPTRTASAAVTPTATATSLPGGNDQLPPANRDQLVPWLQAGSYLGWRAEGRRPGSQPHFNVVRTFVNDALFASLDGNTAAHPQGAAAVKELFGSGTEVRGWAVAVKIGGGNSGNDWYWFESFNGRVLTSGVGVDLCTGCHASGTDYICTPFPLQPGGQALPPRCP
jgi:hypothetical protein